MDFIKDKRLILLISISLVFLFVAAPVLARYQPYPPMPKIKGEQTASPSSSRKEKKDLIEQRLSEAKKNICEKLESGINKRSDGLVSRVNKHTARFSRISDKVQVFYEEKMEPKGMTVENYDTLVANITTKEAAAKEAAEAAKDKIAEFDCSGDNPKEALNGFRHKMINVITSLKEYRKSVVDLIVAVRTAFNNAKDKEATSSAN